MRASVSYREERYLQLVKSYGEHMTGLLTRACATSVLSPRLAAAKTRPKASAINARLVVAFIVPLLPSGWGFYGSQHPRSWRGRLSEPRHPWG
jgi:hypothetical protein